MNACRILCPGPSLASYEDDFEGLVIAVNRAAMAFACDYWCAGDGEPIAKWGGSIIGQPKLFTRSQTPAPPGWCRPVSWESLYSFHTPMRGADGGWDVFSLTAAVVLAASSDCRSIEVFGCDWTTAPDFDGNADAMDGRQPHRWERERRIFARLARELGSNGFEVTRHGHA